MISFKKLYFIILLILASQVSILHAQINQGKNEGLNDYLYNGKIYTYHPPYNVIGIPFLSTKQFSNSTLWIHGNAYPNLKLNYDLINQKVVLSFVNYLGAQQKISLSLAYVDSFLFEEKHFIVDWNSDNPPSIYQQIKYGNYGFKIFWKKSVDLNSSASGSIAYEFSDPIRQLYFVSYGKLVLLKRRKQFKKLFPQDKSASIIKFIKQNHWKIIKMTDGEYLRLLVFINNLDNE